MHDIELTYTPAQLRIFFDPEPFKYKIVTKGRRFGATEGAEKAFIEWALEGISPLLWVDTINGNIDKYFERYFLPDLKKLPQGKWSWNQQKRVLKIYSSMIDFRSADIPQNIEGFGYKKIFLNEAGIILKDDYLYTNAILPMMLDYPESQLIAAGVPKGKHKKDGNKHKFFELYERALAGTKNYKLLEFTSYDNPLLSKADIDELIEEVSATNPLAMEQEIYGRFIEYAGENVFATNYKIEAHESEAVIFDPGKQLIISLDFNINPFAVGFSNLWQDTAGMHDWQFDEASIANGSVQAMIDLIRTRYSAQLPNCRLTGDAMGKKREITQRDNANIYLQLERGLGLRPGQVVVPANPSHDNSRADVNYVLYHSSKPQPDIDIKINPKTCPETCRDLRTVQCDAFGSIIKRDRKDLTQRADFLDQYRYKINTFWREWILFHQKHNRGK